MTEQIITGRTAGAIALSIERAVADGALAPGHRLPSVRGLAVQLGVSPTTVSGALADLRRRGVVVSKPRSGTVVARRPPIAPSTPLPIPEGVRDLSSGNPDPALLPDVHKALRTLKGPPRLYGEDPVAPELSAIVGEDCCVVNGALDGIERVLAARLAPGDGVAVEDPGFSVVVDVVRALGLVPVAMPIDERGPVRVPDGVRAIIITPRGQNPTGAVLGGDLEILSDVLVIEDDHLGEVAGVPARTVTEDRQAWAIVRSTSKWLGPDLRLAIVTGDPTTLRRVQGRQAAGPGWVSTLIQRTVAALMADPDMAALAEQAATVYAGRRRALLAALQSHGIPATGPTGLNVWIPVDDEDAVVAGMLAAGWAVSPGARFRLNAPPAIRVTISTLRPEEARRLAADLAAVLATPLRRAS